jgi:predicted Zn-dependent peptidase
MVGVNNASLIIAGDVTRMKLKPMLEKYFSWMGNHMRCQRK